jgi:membrane glycosyltransferase
MTLGILAAGLAENLALSFHPGTGLTLFVLVMTMIFAPKLATVIDVLLTARRRRAFGGAPRILAGLVTEVLFFTLLAPVMALAHTRFLAGLPFGHAAVWSAQRRSSHRVGVAEALRRLWPQTLFGGAVTLWIAALAPAALIGFLPFLLGAILAVPVAVLTSGSRVGTGLAAVGLWRIPDETVPAAELAALHLPALAHRRPALATAAPAATGVTGE